MKSNTPFSAYRTRALILGLIFSTLLGYASAQQPAQPAPQPSAFTPVESLPIVGTMTINYRTRTADENASKAGTTDVYTLDVLVANSSKFTGTIENRPYIQKWVGSNQGGFLRYDMIEPTHFWM